MSRNRIGIVYPFPTLDSVPSILSAVELLSRAGYRIDLFAAHSRHYQRPAFTQSTVHLTNIQWPLGDSALRGRLMRALCRRLSRITIWLLGVRITATHFLSGYRCLIGVDPSGLRIASWFNFVLRVPLVYYSLELLLSNEIDENKRLQALKKAERAASQKCRFAIVQDRARANLLKADNGLSDDQVVCVPNAPLGNLLTRERFWHEKFDLPPSTRVVLVSGSAEAWAGVKEIIESTDFWPDNWVLVVHTRAVDEDSSYMGELYSAAGGRPVYLSLNAVPRCEYDQLVASAEIGVAFYVMQMGSWYTQENIRTIGLSSGKVAYYLRAGLPVIVNHSSSLAEFVRENGCGVVVFSPDEIGAAICEIERRYEELKQRASRAFKLHLDFERCFAQVLLRIANFAR